MARAWALVPLVLIAGCVTSSSTICDDGSLCPTGTVCASVELDSKPTAVCVTPEQIAACASLADRASCGDSGPATCHGGACLRDECGNRLLDALEACDDGNTLSADGCNGTCTSQEACGNAITDLAVGETCDEGDWLAHDGCSTGCGVETPVWRPLENARPSPRSDAAAVYDRARRRVVVFGGAGDCTP